MKTSTQHILFVVFISIFFCNLVHAQVIPPPIGADTVRIIQIVKGKSLREKTIDSANVIETIAGNVELREGLTIFYCDSAVIYRSTNILEAYGNIHVNQNDSIHTYSQYLKYIGKDRMAYLKKDVRLTDKKGTLYTQELEYDLRTGIGKYFKGGKVVNGKTILTSIEGTYYAETKDVIFKKDVHLNDPKYSIVNDTLMYNTQSQTASWNTATYIKSQNGGDIYSKEGTYDLKEGRAFFGKRTVIKDSTRTYVSDNSAYNEADGIAQLEGNAVVKDSVNGYTVLGGQIFLNKKDNSFLATQKPVLIFKGEGNDSTFISADTLYSGIEQRNEKGETTIRRDTLKTTTVVSVLDSGQVLQSVKGSDTLQKNQGRDSVVAIAQTKADTAFKTMKPVVEQELIDSFSKQTDTLQEHKVNNNGMIPVARKDSGSILNDSLKIGAKDSAIRFFLAFHHVRIFNDSVQSVCDSLFYSSKDSTFRLYKDPLVFSNKSQVAGDTIYLYTFHKKAKRIYVFNNGMIINRLNKTMYNQMAGRTINAYFKDGAIDYARIKGAPAESIFFPQDDDSAYVGLNRSKGDVIDVYFFNKEIHRIKFINDVDGTLYPMRLIPDDQRYLTKFKWQDERRPKNKYELFE